MIQYAYTISSIFLRRTTLIQYLLLYKVICFCCFVFWGAVWEGRLLFFCRYASALFYVYACEYCFCSVLCRCLYVSLCMLGVRGAGSFAGARSSLAYKVAPNPILGAPFCCQDGCKRQPK